MNILSGLYDQWLHKYLNRKLKEFDRRDASQEEVAEFLAKYGYFKKN